MSDDEDYCVDCGATPEMCWCDDDDDDDGWCEGDDGVCDDPYCCAPPERAVTTIDTGGLT